MKQENKMTIKEVRELAFKDLHAYNSRINKQLIKELALENRIFNQIIENQELTIKTIFQPSMPKSYIEETLKEFDLTFMSGEAEMFGRRAHVIWTSKENMSDFIRSALTKLVEEQEKDCIKLYRRFVSQPAEYKGSTANVWREGFNFGIESALQILKKYKE